MHPKVERIPPQLVMETLQSKQAMPLLSQRILHQKVDMAGKICGNIITGIRY